MIVLDASVLIAHLSRTDPHHDRADGLLARQIDDDFGVSTLTLAEMLVTPTREGRLEDVQRALANLELVELTLPDTAAVSLARLRHETRLKLPDCCVMLTASHYDARVASFDAKLMTAAAAQGLALVDS